MPSNRQPGTTCHRRSPPAGRGASVDGLPVDVDWSSAAWLGQRRRCVAGGRVRRRRRDLRLACRLGFGGDLALALAPLRGERRLHAFVMQALLLDLLEPDDLLLGPALGGPGTPRWRPVPRAVGLRAGRVSRRARDPPPRTRRASPPTNRWRRRTACRRRRRRSPPRHRSGAGSDATPEFTNLRTAISSRSVRKAATSASRAASSLLVESISTAS